MDSDKEIEKIEFKNIFEIEKPEKYKKSKWFNVVGEKCFNGLMYSAGLTIFSYYLNQFLISFEKQQTILADRNISSLILLLTSIYLFLNVIVEILGNNWKEKIEEKYASILVPLKYIVLVTLVIPIDNGNSLITKFGSILVKVAQSIT